MADDNDNGLVTRARGIKKSDFIQKSAIPAGSTFDFVIDGTNIKISAEALLAALGVTGTIVTAGAATATPILQTSGTENRIRSVEDGPGIITSISPENGIVIGQNFAQDVTGLPILKNPTDLTPDLISLVAGVGIGLAVDGNAITVSATGTALPATKAVSVNVIGDFPAPVGGVITLEAATVYIVSNDISTANRFVMAMGTSLVGYSAIAPVLTYTGSATMFTGVDVNVGFFSVSLDCPSGKLFDFSDTVGGLRIFQLNTVRVGSCDTIGDFDSMRTVSFNGFLCFAIATDGILTTQTQVPDATLYRFESMSVNSTNAGFKAIDLGTAVSQTITIEGCIFEGVAGSVALDGAVSNGNLTTNGIGEVLSCTFNGLIDPVASINLQMDVNWVALANQRVEDTRPDSLSHNTAGTTVVIGVINTPVVVAGTWVDEDSAHFTVNLDGTVTYVGIEDLHVPITGGITLSAASGSNKDFTSYIAIDGVAIAASGRPGRTSAGDRSESTPFWQHTFITGQVVSIMVENNTDTTNFTIAHGILRVD